MRKEHLLYSINSFDTDIFEDMEESVMFIDEADYNASLEDIEGDTTFQERTKTNSKNPHSTIPVPHPVLNSPLMPRHILKKKLLILTK